MPTEITYSKLLRQLFLGWFRGLFIIDDKGILRQITMNDLPVSCYALFDLLVCLVCICVRLVGLLTRLCVWFKLFSTLTVMERVCQSFCLFIFFSSSVFFIVSDV